VRVGVAVGGGMGLMAIDARVTLVQGASVTLDR
jgi:hypothetical protein